MNRGQLNWMLSQIGYAAEVTPKVRKHSQRRTHVVLERGRVRRIDDPHHPRGYRERCNDDEMRDRKLDKIREQGGMCALCHEPLPSDPREVELDHRRSKGMGGAWRDDHRDNLQAVHSLCNSDKGSKNMATAAVDYEAHDAQFEQALQELESRVCVIDEKPKRAGTSFCADCMTELNDQMKLDLYRCTGVAWVEAHRNGKGYLLGRR